MCTSRFTRRDWSAFSACTVMALTTLSCGDSVPSASSTVSRLDASPSSLALVTDESRDVIARAYNAAGTPLARPLHWSVSSPTVISVTQGGIVTGVSAGVAQLAVSSGGKSVLIPVTVAERAVALVRVTPANPSVRVGSTVPLAAQLVDATGAAITGRTILWTSGSVAVASVSGVGVVTGVSPGNATIFASSGGVSGTSLVSVVALPVASVAVAPSTVAMLDGASATLTAVVRDSAGRTLNGRVVTWSSSAPTIANVSSAGAVLAIAPGTATITATSEGKSSSARVTVAAVPVASITVSPVATTLIVGETAPLVARAADSTGAPLAGRTIVWSSTKPSAASVNAVTGVVTAIAAGQASITATSEGKSGAAVVTVTPVPVASIQVTPASATMLAGESQRLTTRLLDAQGKVLPGRVVTFIGGAPAVATVDSTGLVRAVAVGTAVIVVLSEGARASVPITVAPITVAKVMISPAAASIEFGGSLQLTAAIVDIRGRPITGKVATWKSSNTTVATVSSAGRLQSLIPGTVTLSATSDGVVGTAAFTVTLVRVASITVLPSITTLTTGRTLPLVLQLADSIGAPLSLTGRTVTWTSAAPTVATVTANGIVTTLSPGTAAVSATTDGRTGMSTITVTAMPVASVRISPPAVQLTAGSTTQLTATALDAMGAPVAGSSVTWSVLNGSVASVSGDGLVTGLTSGTTTVTARAQAPGQVTAATASMTLTVVP